MIPLRKRNGCLVLATLLLCAAAGCTTGGVASPDRLALWNASVRAMEEQGFDRVVPDITKGQIIATQQVSGVYGNAREKLRITVLCTPASGGFRARVTARRSLTDDSLKDIDKTRRVERNRAGGTGRSVGQYGSVGMRDTGLERRILARIRTLLVAPTTP